MVFRYKLVASVIVVVIQTTVVLGEGVCNNKDEENKSGEALKFKIVAIASILTAGAIGVSLPLLGRKIEALRPENDIFFMIKAFAAGVILATGFLHILPEAFQTLTSPCLDPNPWGKFPFTGFIAMIASIGTNENGSTALIVEGVFNSASAGILIYMALVDLLAADFMSSRMRSNIRLQLGAHTSLLLGATCMSFMARWV